MRPKRNRSERLRWLLYISVGSAVVVAGLWGTDWWRERPLAEIDRRLTNNESPLALKLTDQFLKTHPGHARAIALKARAFVQLGRPSEALQLIDQVGAASQADMRAYAQACLMLEKWMQALPVLEYLLQLDPENSGILHEVSACRAKLGRSAEAVEAAVRFAAIKGNEARGNLLVGMLERDRGNDRKACEAWTHVLQLNPDASDLQIPPDVFTLDFGTVLLEISEPGRAAEQFRKSLEIKHSTKALALLGKACSQLGLTEEAEKHWRIAVMIDSADAASRQGLAELAMKRSDFREALDWLRPLAESSELSSATAFLLQRAYSLTGDSQSASAWQSKVDQIRKQEELVRTVDQILIDSPASMWGQVLRSHRLAEQGNWEQADILLAPYRSDDVHPFVRELSTAIENHGTLPDFSALPIELFR